MDSMDSMDFLGNSWLDNQTTARVMDRVHRRYVCTFSKFLLISSNLVYGYPELCVETILLNVFAVSVMNNKKIQFSGNHFDLFKITKSLGHHPKNVI